MSNELLKEAREWIEAAADSRLNPNHILAKLDAALASQASAPAEAGAEWRRKAADALAYFGKVTLQKDVNEAAEWMARLLGEALSQSAAPPSDAKGVLTAEVEMLRQLVEETVLVAQTDDADGFISAYHFKAGAIHRLLAAVRTRNYPPHIEQQYPAYQRRASYTPADPAEMAAHVERVRHDVIPEIDEQQRRKHSGQHKVVPASAETQQPEKAK